jgi:zinc transport system substrate-binding protein
MYTKRVAPLVALASLLALSACADDADASAAGAAGRSSIVTSFYPLQYVAARIAGDRATVTGLTPPGVEPHDLELTPRDVASVSDADLVVYLRGFQSSVDEAVEDEAKGTALDVAPAARLDRRIENQGDEGTDPHFWLDPQRLKAVAGLVEQRLARADPAGAATFAAGLKAVSADLDALDASYRDGLADCVDRDLVTSHQAFGYLAERYGLTQVGISGLTPEEEPDPATLARVSDFVRAHQVRTIYYETLVSPAIARTVAGETGARTAVLDPIEGITDASAGRDYLTVMRANLRSLQEGQPCP